MIFLNLIKYIFLFFLTFLFGTLTTYAKTELILLQNQVLFSIEQTQNFKSLEKEVPPNIGFLKEKSKFGKSIGSSTRINCNFSKRSVEVLANASGAGSIISKGGKIISKEVNDIVESVFSNSNKLNHLIEGSSNSVHRWETLVPDKNSVEILDIVKETLQHGTDELYNGVTLTKVSAITRNGITKNVQITYANVNGKLTPSNGWVKP